jgi:NADH pyrophosphatase NudC (nudix superfamily)
MTTLPPLIDGMLPLRRQSPSPLDDLSKQVVTSRRVVVWCPSRSSRRQSVVTENAVRVATIEERVFPRCDPVRRQYRVRAKSLMLAW